MVRILTDRSTLTDGNPLADWPTQLAELIKKDGVKHVDVVIDSAGGEQLMTQVSKVLKQGGIVVCYGM